MKRRKCGGGLTEKGSYTIFKHKGTFGKKSEEGHNVASFCKNRWRPGRSEWDPAKDRKIRGEICFFAGFFLSAGERCCCIQTRGNGNERRNLLYCRRVQNESG